MPQKWFVEERYGSEWHPKFYVGDKPSIKTMTGTRRVFRAEPVEVPTHLDHLTLGQAREIFSPEGRFQATR